MIRFAAMLEAMAHDRAAVAAYLLAADAADRAAAADLLAGHRPRRIAGLDALVHWAAEVAGVPEWLMEAALVASGDRAEVAALLLAEPSGAVPGLAEVVDRLNRCTRVTAHATLVGLWARLPRTLAETPEIMAWIRANVTGRFGPVRLVPPVHLFEIAFDALSPNPRRKCGFDLVGAAITRWLPDQAGSADHLDALKKAL